MCDEALQGFPDGAVHDELHAGDHLGRVVGHVGSKSMHDDHRQGVLVDGEIPVGGFELGAVPVFLLPVVGRCRLEDRRGC